MWLKKIYFSFLIILIFQSCYSEAGIQGSAVSEVRSFSYLMKADSLDRKTRAAAAINQFLNDQPEDTVAAVLIENNSNCNIIMKIDGKNNHLLPIPKYGRNFLVLKKGNYSFQSKLCNSEYSSFKNIQESVNITVFEK